MSLSRPFRTSRRLLLEPLEDRTTPAVYTVTSAADAGPGSLRNAIAQANAAPDADTIAFDPGLVGQTITLTTIGDTSVGPADLVITNPVTIQGGGQILTRSGAAARLITVAPTGNLTLSNLTLTNGLAQGGAGGTGGGAAGLGGAIYVNQGSLSLFNDTLTGNQAVGGAGGGSGAVASRGGGGLAGPGDASGNGGGPSGGAGGTGAGATGINGGFGGGGGGGTDGVATNGASMAGGAGGFGGYGGAGGAGGNGGGTAAVGGAGGFGGFGGGGGGGGAGGNGGGQGAGGQGGFGGGFGASGGPGIGGGGGGAGLGGAVFNQGGTVVAGNTTLTGNTAKGGDAPAAGAAAGSGYGGGIFNLNGSVALTSVTDAGNTVSAGAGAGAGQATGAALYNLSLNVGLAAPGQAAAVALADTILANSVGGPDVFNNQQNGTASLNVTGPTLVSISIGNANAAGTISGPTLILVADPNLGPLQSNGGPTQTMALLAGSPALDAGDNKAVAAAALGTAAPFYDQRGIGFNRISNAKVDLGAFEAQVAVTLDPTGLPAATVGIGYSQSITAGGPAGPYTFAVTSGALPAGLTLDNTGGLTGTPTAAGAFSFTVAATNGTAETGSRTYTLTVAPVTGANGPPVELVGGTADGTAEIYTLNNGQLTAGDVITFFPNSQAVVRPAVADVNGDGVPDFIGATGAGVQNQVVVIDGKSRQVLATFSPFEATFAGGLYVAAADLTGDGKADLIVTPDQTGGPVAAVYDGAKLAQGAANNATLGQPAQIVRFLGINDVNFRGGARPAVADINGDGTPDLVVAAGFGGGPRVAIYDGKSVAAGVAAPAELLPDFFTFESSLRNGVFVTAGNVDGDGKADLIFGGGPGGAPRVRVVSGAALLATTNLTTLDSATTVGLQLANFFAGDPTTRGGVPVSAKSLTTVGRVDLIAASGQGVASQLLVYKGSNLLANVTPVPDQTIDPFASAVLVNGAYVG